VIISADRHPRLQIDEAEPFDIDSCAVERDVDHSILTDVVCSRGPVRFAPGSRVTLYSAESVLFVGKAVDEHSVLDLMSTEPDEELTGDEPI
jgi:hypothetical protein